MYFINHNDVVEIYQWTQCFIIIQSPINTYKTPFVLNKRAISIQCTTPIIWSVANRDRFVITFLNPLSWISKKYFLSDKNDYCRKKYLAGRIHSAISFNCFIYLWFQIGLM